MTTTLLTIAVIILLLVAGAGLGWALRAYRCDHPELVTKDEAEVEYNDHQHHVLTGLLNKSRGPNGIRYEIELSDWGPDQGEMRWRWVAWDADRYLTVLLNPEADAIGREIPAMLGNAPTKIAALRDANHWVMDEGSTAIVVLPVVTEPPA